MTDFNIGDEVIFKNHRLQLGDRVVFTDNFRLSNGRISDFHYENNQIHHYLIRAIDSDFSVVTCVARISNVVRTVSSLNREVWNMEKITEFNVGDEVIFKNNRLVLSGRISHCFHDEDGNILHYFVMAVNSNFWSIDVYTVPVRDLIRTVSSLDKLELSK